MLIHVNLVLSAKLLLFGGSTKFKFLNKWELSRCPQNNGKLDYFKTLLKSCKTFWMEVACITAHRFAALLILPAKAVSLCYYNVWVQTLCSTKENSVKIQNKGLGEIYKGGHIFSLLSNLLGGEEEKKSAFLWGDALHLFIHIVCGIVPASLVLHKSTQ